MLCLEAENQAGDRSHLKANRECQLLDWTDVYVQLIGNYSVLETIE